MDGESWLLGQGPATPGVSSHHSWGFPWAGAPPSPTSLPYLPSLPSAWLQCRGRCVCQVSPLYLPLVKIGK